MADVRQWASSSTKKRKPKARIGEIRERRGGKYKKVGERKWERVVEGRPEKKKEPTTPREKTAQKFPEGRAARDLRRLAQAEKGRAEFRKKLETRAKEPEKKAPERKPEAKKPGGGEAERALSKHGVKAERVSKDTLSVSVEDAKKLRALGFKEGMGAPGSAGEGRVGISRNKFEAWNSSQQPLDLGESKNWQSWKAKDLKELKEPHEGLDLGSKPWTPEPPPGMMSGKFAGHPPGGRGGTEQMHWDPKTNDYTPERRAFHDQVVGSYFEGKVPAKGQKVAIVMMGGTASGKSTMLRTAGKGGPDFVHVDPDDIKGKLPEYREAIKKKYKGAASMAHEESSTLGKRVLKEAQDGGYNLVLDGTGANGEKYARQVQALKDKGYFVHLMMPDQDMAKAVSDAGGRAERTGRHVPNSFIEGAYKSIPGNFHKIAKIADSAQLFDRRRDGKMVWEKSPEGKVTDHDPEFVSKYPGLAGFTGR